MTTVNVFIFIFVAFFCTQISFAAMPSNTSTAKNPFIPVLPVKETSKPADEEKTLKPESIAKQRPDVSEPPSVTINGLVWNTRRPQAIVNKKVVAIGDTVDDFTIASITKAGIDIVYNGETFFIAYVKQKPLW